MCVSWKEVLTSVRDQERGPHKCVRVGKRSSQVCMIRKRSSQLCVASKEVLTSVCEQERGPHKCVSRKEDLTSVCEQERGPHKCL